MGKKDDCEEYYKIHTWLYKHYGKATKCENPNCKGKSKFYEWAMIHELGYDYKRENFRMLCKSCHSAYDGIWNKGKTGVYSKDTLDRISKTLMGHEINDATKSKISNTLIGSRFINNGIENKYVKPHELQQYLDNGYVIGRLIYDYKVSAETKLKISNSLKGRLPKNKGNVLVNNNIKNIYVKPHELQQYLDNGYTKGRIKRK